jgi:ribosomal protein L37E
MSLQNYENAWREYRRINRRFVLALLACFPLNIFMMYFGEKLFHTFDAFFVFAFSWVGLINYYAIRKMLWRCPRCGKRFAFWGWFPFFGMPTLERRCAHCGLPRYAKEAEQYKGNGA